MNTGEERGDIGIRDQLALHKLGEVCLWTAWYGLFTTNRRIPDIGRPKIREGLYSLLRQYDGLCAEIGSGEIDFHPYVVSYCVVASVEWKMQWN